ncbi:hypothetical protein CCMA1212_008563 [Trichoderma ghanense]|uniref:Hemerythrin-like domain-containing protein n=1 Tax=Trichoderma ghanense TaxID=65468 RepID=A0ABY2GUW1_9HYPO
MSILRSQAFCIASRVARQAQPRWFSTTPLLRDRISDAIVKDHRELEHYYNRITESKDYDEQTRWQNQFVWELARHSISEELVVYPIFETLVNGQQIADKDRAEHRKVKEKLYIFQKLSASDPEFIPTLNSLYADLKQHIKEEEEDDLPKLEQAVSGDESLQLSKSFQRTKMFVPTHSHPSAPDKPPFETVVGLLSAPLDRLMDAFKRFPKN